MSRTADPARKRYTKRLAVLMTLYLVFLFLAVRTYNVDGGGVDGALAWAIAILPALPVIGVFWAILAMIVETTDEYQRLKLVKQTLIAAGFALSVMTVLGFLANFGLIAPVDGFWSLILFFFGLGIGSCVTAFAERRADRAAGDAV